MQNATTSSANTMKAYEVLKIGQNRGSPRLWLEGIKAKMAGFLPGLRYSIRKDDERKMLVLELAEDGLRVVSKKLKGNVETPVIDINSKETLSIFEGFESVRVIVQKTRITVLPMQVDIAKNERLQRVISKLESGEALNVGSLSHGGGVLSHAMHHGLMTAGIPNRLAFANDIRPELLEQSSRCNDAWDPDTIALAAPMLYLAFDVWAMEKLPKIEVLEAGLPCSGASVSGRAKNGAGHAESHAEVGHLVVPFLAMIAKLQPAVICLENVVPYQNTGSMCIIRNFLRDYGYQVHETTLHAEEWNALENRVRMCMIAVTEGLHFDFEALKRPEKKTCKIAEVLDPVPADDPMWSQMQGLKIKQERDLAAGKNFKMQIVNAFDTACPTITKGYAKIRSTDPKLQHPSNPDLLRQFTPAEHARIKQISERLVEGMSATVAHELLGQSICYEPFKAVAVCIGEMLKSIANVVAPKQLAVA